MSIDSRTVMAHVAPCASSAFATGTSSPLRRLHEMRGLARQYEAKLRTMLTAIEDAGNGLAALARWRLGPPNGDRKGISSLKVTDHQLTFPNRRVRGRRSILRTTIGEKLMPMQNPSHPDGVSYRSLPGPLGIGVSVASRLLGVRPARLSAGASGTASRSPDRALRSEKAFGPEVGLMLPLHAAGEAAQVRKPEKPIKVKPHVAKAAA
jgi:antitoxin HigA-1